MVYSQFVQVGRLALVVFGQYADKLAVIVDIVDDKRVMVDIIGADVREMIPVKRLRLTDFVAEMERGAAPADVKKAIDAQKIMQKWEESHWAKDLKKGQARSAMNDFQRFKYAKLAAKRDEIVAKELAKH